MDITAFMGRTEQRAGKRCEKVLRAMRREVTAGGKKGSTEEKFHECSRRGEGLASSVETLSRLEDEHEAAGSRSESEQEKVRCEVLHMPGGISFSRRLRGIGARAWACKKVGSASRSSLTERYS